MARSKSKKARGSGAARRTRHVRNAAGPVVIVTGGSRGIGAACALLAGARGWRVVINYRSEKRAAERVVTAIRRSGSQAIAVQGDMAVEADVLKLFREADRAFGRLDGLINNAGITGKPSRVDQIGADPLRRVLEVNIVGPFLCAREAIKRMSSARRGRGGAIVNISSAAARLGGPGEWVHYGASKGAIDTMTIGLGREVAAEGIRVNAVRPGLIDTDIHATAGLPDRVAKLAPTVPMRRAGSAEEVADTVIWLLSDDSSYVTSSIVDVSGGR
ncbi:MAG: SDR family oxidoreductase [Alphaproteobacteria bacterium]|nr:SDR family oxidoreductase [Alphaproteobacteria bacterium]